jgi:hypothetical protein
MQYTEDRIQETFCPQRHGKKNALLLLEQNWQNVLSL